MDDDGDRAGRGRVGGLPTTRPGRAGAGTAPRDRLAGHLDRRHRASPYGRCSTRRSRRARSSRRTAAGAGSSRARRGAAGPRRGCPARRAGGRWYERERDPVPGNCAGPRCGVSGLGDGPRAGRSRSAAVCRSGGDLLGHLRRERAGRAVTAGCRGANGHVRPRPRTVPDLCSGTTYIVSPVPTGLCAPVARLGPAEHTEKSHREVAPSPSCSSRAVLAKQLRGGRRSRPRHGSRRARRSCLSTGAGCCAGGRRAAPASRPPGRRRPP